MSGTGDKTEKPTGKRLKDARKKGQVVRSRNMGAAFSLAAAVIALAYVGRTLVEGLGRATAEGIVRAGTQAVAPIGAGEIVSLVGSQGTILAQLVAPIAFAVIGTTVAIQVAQGGWVFAPEALSFDLSRLSPMKGLKRLGISQAGVETLKMLISVVVLTWIAVPIIQHFVEDSPRLARLSLFQATSNGWDEAVHILKQTTVALVILACADYGVQRWRFMAGMKMSKQEVKEEGRNAEGNPETKGRVRRIQREMFRRRMLSNVGDASFIVTNPTHYAVALEYRRGSQPAPKVVAKGKNLLALKIKEIARDKGIPIVENRALAQALYKGVEVGDIIPGSLFEAVAEVLAYLIRIKQLALG